MRIQRSANPLWFFSKKEKEQIVEAIRSAEKKTSGEIRVHLERKARPDIFKHAAERFEKLGMVRTESRNGVLIFMGIKSKRFVILGDKGINEKVPQGFWDEIVALMGEQFRKDHFADGLCDGIEKIGEKLAFYFPYQRDDRNELSDEISYA
ncbi:MAG: TPM domain-containing protein [Candidatus Omnitrophica bacterium]|nr:TPM domain-containing protein [Candidatus Omnitrophota bacterium]